MPAKSYFDCLLLYNLSQKGLYSKYIFVYFDITIYLYHFCDILFFIKNLLSLCEEYVAMTIAQISYFMEVAQCQSFSKAAARLYISQPAISKQVALLEKSLGVTLVDRTYGGAQLTQAGKMFYDFFRKSELEFGKVVDEVRKITSGHAGNLRLGCLDGWDLSAFYPEFRGLLAEKYPKMQVALDGYNHIQVVDALRSNEIDLAIALEIVLQGQSDIHRRNVTSAPVVVLISALHPLAKKEHLTLADFKDDPFYAISPTVSSSNPMEQLAIDVCQAAGFTPRIEHTPNSASTLMRLQNGTGVQITCAWTGACRLPLYRVIPLDRMLNISVAWLDTNTNPARQVFIDELYRHYHPSK